MNLLNYIFRDRVKPMNPSYSHPNDIEELFAKSEIICPYCKRSQIIRKHYKPPEERE